MPGRRRERSPRLTGAGLLPAAVASARMFRSRYSCCPGRRGGGAGGGATVGITGRSRRRSGRRHGGVCYRRPGDAAQGGAGPFVGVMTVRYHLLRPSPFASLVRRHRVHDCRHYTCGPAVGNRHIRRNRMTVRVRLGPHVGRQGLAARSDIAVDASHASWPAGGPGRRIRLPRLPVCKSRLSRAARTSWYCDRCSAKPPARAP